MPNNDVIMCLGFNRWKPYFGLVTAQNENRRGHQRAHEDVKQGTAV